MKFFLTSMDGDGTKEGYDIALNKAINDAIDIPVIASGGGRKSGTYFRGISKN